MPTAFSPLGGPLCPHKKKKKEKRKGNGNKPQIKESLKFTKVTLLPPSVS